MSYQSLDPISPLRRLLRGLLLCLLVWPVAVLSISGEAWADGPTPEEREQSREYFEQGAEFFFEERYGRALVMFRRAHRLNPHPMILYNKSLANLRLGNFEEAYRRGVEAGQMPGLPERETVRNDARIAALAIRLTADDVSSQIARKIALEAQRRRAEEEERRRAEEQEEKRRRAEEEEERRRAEEEERAHEPDRPVTEPVRPPIDDDPGGLGALGWTGVAMTTMGGGLLAYAGVVEFRLRDQISEYEDASERGDSDAYFELRDDIDTATTRGRIALYSGGGLAAVGLTLWLVGALSGSSSSAHVQLTPAVVPGESAQGFIQLNGRF